MVQVNQACGVVVVNDRAIGDGNGDGISGSSSGMDSRPFIKLSHLSHENEFCLSSKRDSIFKFVIVSIILIRFEWVGVSKSKSMNKYLGSKKM